MEAERVIEDEFSSKEVTLGFVVSIRDPSYVENGNQAPHIESYVLRKLSKGDVFR